VVFEIAVGAVIATYLYMRGWTWRRLRFAPSWSATGVGIVLYAAYMGAYVVIELAARWLIEPFYGGNLESLFRVDADRGAIIALSIVNPVYEETFVVGYIVRSFEGRASPWVAINLSTAIRLVYHLYQGPIACAAIIPMGLIFSWYYTRRGKLWPLIVAHALGDFIPLSMNGSP
jgi:membrane protease YdiL (CAAX protease family)